MVSEVSSAMTPDAAAAASKTLESFIVMMGVGGTRARRTPLNSHTRAQAPRKAPQDLGKPIGLPCGIVPRKLCLQDLEALC